MATTTHHPPHDPAAPAAPAEPGSAPVDPSSRARWLILAVVSLAQLAVVLDATIVNIALPTAQRALGFSDGNRQWVVTAYALAFGSLLLVGGRLSDLVGRRAMFVTGLLGFATASAVGGAAQSFEMLVAARAAQGVFAALLAPAALSLVTVTFSRTSQRGRAFAIFGAISGAGGAVGLILGGVLTEYLSWRWCLYVNVPIAAVALIGALLVLPRHQSTEDAPGLDVPGTLLSSAGLVSLVFGLAHAETAGWTSPATLAFITLGVALLAAFCAVQARVAHPLLPLRIVLDRTRGGSYLAVGLVGAGMFGVFLFLTYYLSTVLGFGPLRTGVSFLPLIVGIMLSAQVAARLVERVGVRLPIAGGFAVAATGLLILTQLGLDSSYWSHVLPGLVVAGLGIGAVLSSAIGTATAGVDPADAGVASAGVNTFQQIGGSIATAVLSALAASTASDYLAVHDASSAVVQATAELHSYTTAFWASAVFMAVGAVVSAFLLPRTPVEHDDAATAPLPAPAESRG